MATVTTRQLSKKDKYDCVPVKADVADWYDANFKPKSGYYKVNITSLTWTNGGALVNYAEHKPRIWIETANFNPESEDRLQDEFECPQTQGTVNFTNKNYFIAVNNAVPGPQAILNSDGTIDLVRLRVEIPEHFADEVITATITYTLTTTELLESGIVEADTQVVLRVNSDKPSDMAVAGISQGTIGSQEGYISVLLQSLTVVGKYSKNDKQPPYFEARCDVPPTFQGPIPSIASHYITTESGVKTYVYKTRMFIFAVNGGKVDICGTAYGDYIGLIRFLLTHLQGSTGDVTVTVRYKLHNGTA